MTINFHKAIVEVRKLKSHSKVGYQDHPNGDRQCSGCSMFIAGNPPACSHVAPPIAAHGYCEDWAPIDDNERARRMIGPLADALGVGIDNKGKVIAKSFLDVMKDFNPDEPRDERGRWTVGGASIDRGVSEEQRSNLKSAEKCLTPGQLHGMKIRLGDIGSADATTTQSNTGMDFVTVNPKLLNEHPARIAGVLVHEQAHRDQPISMPRDMREALAYTRSATWADNQRQNATDERDKAVLLEFERQETASGEKAIARFRGVHKEFNPDEVRDDKGKWTSGGGSASSGAPSRLGFRSNARNPARMSHGNVQAYIPGAELKPAQTAEARRASDAKQLADAQKAVNDLHQQLSAHSQDKSEDLYWGIHRAYQQALDDLRALHQSIFGKAFNPDEPRDTHGMWTAGSAAPAPDYIDGHDGETLHSNVEDIHSSLESHLNDHVFEANKKLMDAASNHQDVSDNEPEKDEVGAKAYQAWESKNQKAGEAVANAAMDVRQSLIDHANLTAQKIALLDEDLAQHEKDFGRRVGKNLTVGDVHSPTALGNQGKRRRKDFLTTIAEVKDGARIVQTPPVIPDAGQQGEVTNKAMPFGKALEKIKKDALDGVIPLKLGGLERVEATLSFYVPMSKKTVNVMFMRHGPTRFNNQTDMSKDRVRSWNNVPLTADGIEDAEKAGEKLKDEGIGYIVSSDLGRAVQTSKIVGKAVGVKPIHDYGMRPWNLGKFTGQSTDDAHDGILDHVENPDKVVDGGESFNTFKARAVQAMLSHIKKAGGKKMLAVSHHRNERLFASMRDDGTNDPKKFMKAGEDPGDFAEMEFDTATLQKALKEAGEGQGEADVGKVGDNQRPIKTLPRDGAGLFVEPDQITPAIAQMLEHNRMRFASHFNYADELGAGNHASYDAKGDYNCGRCNMADGGECLLVDIKRVDLVAGSCGDWESIRLGDPEMRLKRKSPDAASYGIAKNGEGFGCHRCPYSMKAKNTDSEGRTSWCGEGGFHITPTACCSANGAETVPYGDDGLAKLGGESSSIEKPTGDVNVSLQLAALDEGSARSPFPYDQYFFSNLRNDQKQRVLAALTDQDSLEEKQLPLSALSAVQDRVDPDKVQSMIEGAPEKLAVVVRTGPGRYCIVDGHHRMTAALLSGVKTVKTKFLDMQRYNPDVVTDDNPGSAGEPLDKAIDFAKALKRQVKESDMDMEIELDLRKMDDDQQLVFGWASVIQIGDNIIIDKQDDIIPEDELEKAAYDFVLYCRKHGDMHDRVGVGRLVQSFVYTKQQSDLGFKAFDPDTGEQILGWAVGFKVDDPGVWKRIKDGALPEFSIGGKAKRELVGV